MLNHRIESDRPVAISQWFHHKFETTLFHRWQARRCTSPSTTTTPATRTALRCAVSTW